MRMMAVCAFTSIWIKANNTDLAFHTHLSTVKHHLSLMLFVSSRAIIPIPVSNIHALTNLVHLYSLVSFAVHVWICFVFAIVFVSTFSILILHEKFIRLTMSIENLLIVCQQREWISIFTRTSNQNVYQCQISKSTHFDNRSESESERKRARTNNGHNHEYGRNWRPTFR